MQLHEQWFQLSNNILCDEFVQVGQNIVYDASFGWPVYIKSYIEGKFGFDVRFRLWVDKVIGHDYRAVVKSAGASGDFVESGAFSINPHHRGVSAEQGQGMVLIIVPELIKDKKGRISWVKNTRGNTQNVVSSIELYISDNCECVRRQPGILGSPIRPMGFFNAGRKVGVSRVSGTELGDDTKLVHGVVQYATKLMEAPRNDDAEFDGRVFHDFDYVRNVLIGSMRLLVGDYAVRVLTKKRGFPRVKFLDVMPCAAKPGAEPLHVVDPHMPSSSGGRNEQQGVKAEDAQGPRDTRAQARRRIAHPKKGRADGQAVNSQPPHEIVKG